ncbi:GTPase domain-containing protein [Micromonospora chalcea]|uniref:GTPase domain-containing protein n=1 Tax=Micromonospora chalcea TaxID=1874 RepID=UPI0033298207
MRWWERVRAWWAGGSRSADGDLALLPLTPQFQPEQHEEYVARLTAALQDPEIRNIALTGRYGAGKSSVLKALSDQHAGRVLNLSLSTLGPPEEEKSITNQIERELVKQLLHSQPQRALPRSRFRRIDKPNLPRAIGIVTAQVMVVALILFLLGRFPRLVGATKEHPWPVRAGAVLLFGLLTVAVLTSIRQAVHNRVVSKVSAVGAAVETAGPGSERRGPDGPTQVPVQHPNRSWRRSMAVRRHVCRAGTAEPPARTCRMASAEGRLSRTS